MPAIIDIGGESTRPGAAPVTRNQELARVLPPIAGLKDAAAALSIDTRHAEVMTRATAAGADIINDVNGLRGEGRLTPPPPVARCRHHAYAGHARNDAEGPALRVCTG